ncbi:MAG: ABC transporter permease [Oscillospiraceae bacterium]|nr:ABC transporter permease [Oscillospiraceae bacterium]
MANLLSANLLRLKKSTLFWGTMILMVVLGAGFALQRVWEQVTYAEFNHISYIDEVFFHYALIIGVVMAVFIPLFFGSEYSDGTIRNKLAVGHSRASVYLAYAVTAAAVSIAFCAAYIAAVLIVGVPFINGGIQRPMPDFLLFLLGSLVMAAAYSALFTLVTMSQSRKAVSAVVCLLGTLTFLFVFFYLRARLSEPEVYTQLAPDENGIYVEYKQSNPRYPRGAKRAAFEFIFDVSPMGQSIHYYSDYEAERPGRMIIFAVLLNAAATATGSALFRKKDLK